MGTHKRLARLIPLLFTLLLLARADVALGTEPGQPLWGTHLVPSEEYGLNDIALARDGTVYASGLNGVLYAVNPGPGAGVKWTYDAESIITTCPAIRYAPPGEDPQYDGTVYIGLGDGRLLAISPQGTLQWEFPAGCTIDGAPAIAKDGTIYVGTRSSRLAAVNPDGSLKWFFATIDVAGVEDPVVGPDGTIYFGTFWENRFYAVNPDGSQQWAIELADPVTTSPAIAANGVLYVGAEWKFYSLYSWGEVRWAIPMWGEVYAAPAIGADGAICVGADTLVAHNYDGTETWHFIYDGTIPGVYRSAPAVDSNGGVYFGSLDEHLYAVHPDGSFHWRFWAYDQVHSSPIIGPDGTLYFCNRNEVFGFYTGSAGLANSAWPMYRHDPERSGRLDYTCIFNVNIHALLELLSSLDVPMGTKRSLAAKLESALRSLEAGHFLPAMYKLGAFVHQVRALAGKRIPARDAQVLIQDARSIISAMEDLTGRPHIPRCWRICWRRIMRHRLCPVLWRAMIGRLWTCR